MDGEDGRGMQQATAVEFPQLPAQWIVAAQQALPTLAKEIEVEIRAAIPEYAHDPDGVVAGNLRGAVTSALQAFLTGLSGHTADDEHLELFRRLGRLEAESGRSHDTLQTAYRIATHQVAEYLALVAGRINSSAAQRTAVRHAVITFIDHLATLSREGYEEANVAGAAEAQATTRLLELMVSPGELSRSKLMARARQVEWAVPERLCALELVPEALFRPAVLRSLREKLGSTLVVGRLPGRCVGFLGAEIELATLTAALPAAATGVLGPAVRMLDAARSARIAYRLGHRASAAAFEAGVVDSNDQLLALFGSDAADVMAVLAQTRLQPLAQLGIVKRMKAARVLSALLEYGGLPRDADELADISPSTLHYRKSMVEEMFGAALRDRDRRVELILGLRAVLPQWEAELAMHERRADAKRTRRARSDESDSAATHGSDGSGGSGGPAGPDGPDGSAATAATSDETDPRPARSSRSGSRARQVGHGSRGTSARRPSVGDHSGA